MEHLALEVFNIGDNSASQYAVLPKDASITITETSEVFESGGIWSYSFPLNVTANAHIFGTSGDLHGSRLHEQINKRKARLWVDGLPLYLGYLMLSAEAEVDADGNVDVSFEGGQKTFEDMIEGAKANQVPMMDDVPIGMALWRKRWTRFMVRLQASARSGDLTYRGIVTQDGEEWFDFAYDGEEDGNSVQEYPRMVFPKGHFVSRMAGIDDWDEDYINTDYPYTESDTGVPTHPYCNVALCYQKYDFIRKMDNGSEVPDYGSEPEAQRGYEYMPANRVNSAPNFYVIYWLRCLMKHLGIHIESNQMMDVEDLRRLFFVNTNCAYEEPQKLRSVPYNERYGSYYYEGGGLIPEYIDNKPILSREKSGLHGTDVEVTAGEALDGPVNISINEVKDWDDDDIQNYINNNNYFHKAYATSDCFPNADISETIKAIESGFGVRFLFSDDYKRVRIVLLRNIFRDQSVQTIDCEIVDMDVKVENNKRGFRMTYGDIDDTHFYYKGFADMLPHKKELWKDNSDTHDYSHWDLDADYANLINRVTAFDKTCYVDPKTGNAYGIKIDKEAKTYDELHPALFGFADFMDAEDGDCTGDEETIETIEVGFTPVIMNDLNMEQERAGNFQQRFALFVDEAMRPRRPDLNDLASPASYNDADAFYDIEKLYHQTDGVYDYQDKMHDGIVKPGEFAIASDMHAYGSNASARLTYYGVTFSLHIDISLNFDGKLNEGYRLYLQDNYTPNDTGISPIETHDWGLMLGIMRGSGSDAKVNYFFDPDDHENNQAWDIVHGSNVVAHADVCDCYGKEWDYNGTTHGIGNDDGRVSLKLRAEKLNPYYVAGSTDDKKKNQYLEISNENLRQRGLCDLFYKEYSFFVRNARIVKRTLQMSLAQLLSIDKTKRVTVGDVTGFVRKTKYSVSNETGLSLVEMEIMYI